MLSVLGATEDQLKALCDASGAEMANLNAREQTVLSGPVAAIEAAEAAAPGLGIRKAIRLNVAGAFHSSLMKDAAEAFAGTLASVEFATPRCPVIANVTGRPHGSDGASIRQAMVQQVYQSVRWYQGIEWMQAQGVDRYLECGPGKVLCGLAKRIDKGAATHSIQELSGLDGLAD
jgi:[acyl-carrier-protein] S-malonyltransferase